MGVADASGFFTDNLFANGVRIRTIVGMNFLAGLLLFLHIIGAAIVFGAWVINFRKPTVLPGQFHAALLSMVTGLLLVGVREMQGADLDHFKIAVKMLLAIIIAVAAYIGQRRVKRGQVVSTGLAHAVGGLALINIAVATLWH